MNNRFEHLKKKTVTQDKNVDEFINGANELGRAKLAKKPVSKQDVLLSISGRMDRGLECDNKPVLLHLKKDISKDIDRYCHGNKQAIINYLVRKGLDQLIEKGELVLVME
jgi:hypothetical protein